MSFFSRIQAPLPTVEVPDAVVSASDDYWSVARQPLNCLLFLLPLLALYEGGVLCLGGRQGEQLRNGADYWMRCGLRQIVGEQVLLLPVLLIGTLLIWQAAGRYPWRVSPQALVGMFAESLIFAFCLVFVGQLQDLAFRQCTHLTLVAAVHSFPLGLLPRVVGFVGAGLYEEVLFRLCLLPACFALLRLCRMPGKPAAVLAILCTSLAFSAAHYIGPAGDQFTGFGFTFRLVAGGFFSLLFFLRGFGITAGCHAAYDLLVGVVLATQVP